MTDVLDLTDLTRTNRINDDELSVKQEVAMLTLLEGGTQRQAAEAAGVTEGTVSRWMDTDTPFYRVYARDKAEPRRRYQARILRMVDQALGSIEYLMRGEEYTGRKSYNASVRLQASVVTLQMAGLLKTSTRVTAFGGAQVNVGEQQINTTGDINH